MHEFFIFYPLRHQSHQGCLVRGSTAERRRSNQQFLFLCSKNHLFLQVLDHTATNNIRDNDMH